MPSSLKVTSNKILLAAAFGTAFSLSPVAVRAQSTVTISSPVADAFVANGTNGSLANLNFGSAGTLAISPASSAKGEFDSLVEFNTGMAFSQFNSLYGAGNWTITGVKLSLASNFPTQGQQPNNGLFNTINTGSFGIDWLDSNNWSEGSGGGMGSTGGGVTFNSIPGLLAGGYDSLGDYTYNPPGNGNYVNYSLQLDSGLLSAIDTGGNVSLYFYAADNQIGYLFNSREFGSNHPEFILTATPVPEPGTLALWAAGGWFALWRARKAK